MENRHTTLFLNKITPLNFCGKVIGFEATASGYELPFEIAPTEGTHDFNKCDGCQKSLVQMTILLKKQFDGGGDKKPFPDCCAAHSNLVKVKEFNRASFVNAPEMAAKKIVYVYQHILNNYADDDWYKKIIHYIEWAVESFGQMPKDCGGSLFLGYFFISLKEKLMSHKEIPAEKRRKILGHLESYQKPGKQSDSDWNILLKTYEKWLKEFPFDLNSYFGNLKSHYIKQFPILKGQPEVNLYSGLAKVKVHTKNSLIEALVNLTDNLLTRINGVALYEKGLITDANKIKLELLIESRKLKLRQGYKNNSQNEEHRYRKLLKEWFSDEKKFIDELTPLLTVTPSAQMQTTVSQNMPDFKKQLSEIEGMENQFWKGIPMEQVIRHFLAMTERKNRNGNVYLTPAQLISFLKRGFLNDKAQRKQKINCSNGEKGFVIKRFYEFFDLAVSQFGHPQRKDKFVKLFDYCFDNWELATIKPFFKRNKTKENW